MNRSTTYFGGLLFLAGVACALVTDRRSDAKRPAAPVPGDVYAAINVDSDQDEGQRLSDLSWG